jgi:hypothetical protein
MKAPPITYLESICRSGVLNFFADLLEDFLVDAVKDLFAGFAARFQ